MKLFCGGTVVLFLNNELLYSMFMDQFSRIPFQGYSPYKDNLSVFILRELSNKKG